MSTERAAAQRATAEAFIKAWTTLDIKAMVVPRSPDCVQITLPQSTLGGPDETNEVWEKRMLPLAGLMKDFEVVLSKHYITPYDLP
jgi:limonene-1,2-epoxide hydrolase